MLLPTKKKYSHIIASHLAGSERPSKQAVIPVFKFSKLQSYLTRQNLLWNDSTPESTASEDANDDVTQLATSTSSRWLGSR